MEPPHAGVKEPSYAEGSFLCKSEKSLPLWTCSETQDLITVCIETPAIEDGYFVFRSEMT